MSTMTTLYTTKIGGNDITKTLEPEDIFRRIVCLVDKLHFCAQCYVHVAEIQLRGYFRDELTQTKYNVN